MKKNVLLIAVVGMLAIGSTFAMAQNGLKHGHERGNNSGCYMMNGDLATGIGGSTEKVTVDGAKAKVQDYVNKNFKGYQVGDVTTETGPRGFTMYVVKATDISGNNFVFHVNPYGYVCGPMLESEYNTMLQMHQQRQKIAPASKPAPAPAPKSAPAK